MSFQPINSFFENFLKENKIFVNKKMLQTNYIPQTVVHRDEFVQEVAAILAPALKRDRPSNLFIYGKTGTGKTLVVKHVTESMNEIARRNNISLRIIYVNCKLKRVADTEYRLIAQLAREFGRIIPSTGLPTDQVYTIFYGTLDAREQTVVLVLDEIDQLAKRAGDNLLYNLTRINTVLKRAQLSIVGISNDLVFIDHVDARVKSSLSEEEILFPPYNAVQIQGILRERAKKGFKENALNTGVIEKCAAYAAREHGDARRALELLRIAGELAERSGCENVGIKHIDEAEDKLDRDRLHDIALNQPRQFQIVLHAILLLTLKNESIVTGEIYSIYEQTAKKIKLRPLTQRRVSDIISELDMLGIIQTKVISKGRYGRSRNISVAIPQASIPKIKELLVASLGL
jgi:archaeal cell division control protein 6